MIRQLADEPDSGRMEIIFLMEAKTEPSSGELTVFGKKELDKAKQKKKRLARAAKFEEIKSKLLSRVRGIVRVMKRGRQPSIERVRDVDVPELLALVT